MKVEAALILGAKPAPFVGPWVPLKGGGLWRYVSGINYGGKVVIDVLDLSVEGDSPEPSSSYPLDGNGVTFKGDFARARILDGVPQDKIVSVMIRCLSSSGISRGHRR